jgi:hypothetical protein
MAFGSSIGGLTGCWIIRFFAIPQRNALRVGWRARIIQEHIKKPLVKA